MPRLVLDARSLGPSEDDGADRMLVGLLAELPAALGRGDQLRLLARPESVDRVRRMIDAEVVSCPVPTASFEQHLGLARWLRAVGLRYDLFHYPQFDLPLLPPRAVNCASIYDVTPLEVPGYFGRGRELRALAAAFLFASTLARADAIVVISEATGERVRARMAARRRGRVHVAMPGPSPAVETPLGPLDAPPPPRFVYVGNHRPHKRVPFLLEAFAAARARVPAAELLLVGRPDPRFPEVPRLLEGPLGEGVTLRSDVEDRELPAILRGARALCFASVGEGFGFPLVEAYAVGTPGVVADAASLPEVAGGAARVLPPDDLAAWTEALVELATDDDAWRSLARETPAALARFSWAQHADEVVTAWRVALRHHR